MKAKNHKNNAMINFKAYTSFFVCLLALPFVLLSFQTQASSFIDWPTISPTEAGFSAEKLKAAKDFAVGSESSAGIVIYKGKILLSWGDITKKFQIYSGRKSLLSALIGIAVQKNKMDVSKTLSDLRIDDIAPSLTSSEKQAKVIDLLKSRSGVYHVSARETEQMKEKRPERGSREPGTFFYYNNWDFNALGAIYQQQTQQTVAEGFKKEIANPLGMQDFNTTDGKNIFEKSLSSHPAAIFSLSARDFARFGLLYLQKGKWDGKEIISASWVQDSTNSYSDASPPKGKGYGYLWWVSPEGDSLLPGVDLGPGAFSAEGLGGQYLIVSPKHEMVVVSFSIEGNAEKKPTFGALKLGIFLSQILGAKDLR
jgi:CubicO group peptidase (beta-lactamase class C family)